jgi:hypothetical protein
LSVESQRPLHLRFCSKQSSKPWSFENTLRI